jgi:hypothetical protein
MLVLVGLAGAPAPPSLGVRPAPKRRDQEEDVHAVTDGAEIEVLSEAEQGAAAQRRGNGRKAIAWKARYKM